MATTTSPDARADVLVAGGGLQAGLIALAVLARRPDATVILVERGRRLGGNHLWSFHVREIPLGLAGVLDELIVARWPETEVIFPDLRRVLSSPYASIASATLDQVVRARLAARPGCAVLTGTPVREVSAGGVVLADGRRLAADLVVDARGPELRPAETAGWQKFVGLEVELARPHGETRPVLMNATVPQRDGYRFVYTLPLAPRRLLVEDTYYSDSPELDAERVASDLLRQLAGQGFEVRDVARVERGVLPLPLAGDGPHVADGAPLVAGYQGGWFHPTTGYSFPVAARLAWAAAAPPEERPAALRRLADETARQAAYARLLNRLLFRAAPPAERWRVLQRFYRLPEATIRRFYDLSMTRADRLRLLFGRPPAGMSLRAAFAAVGAS
jgi:lycopene beta-cyclase